MNTQTAAYLHQFLGSLPTDSPYRTRKVTAEGWGDSPSMADELGALIAAGVKTATCSALAEWQSEGEEPPEPGLLTVVLDGADKPLCIIETVEVTVKPFNQVDAAFADEEGEGDRSLAYWRAAHQRFFESTFERIGGKFTEEILLVCERFKKIYPI